MTTPKNKTYYHDPDDDEPDMLEYMAMKAEYFNNLEKQNTMTPKEQTLADLTRKNEERKASIKKLEAELMVTQNAIEKLAQELLKPEPKEGEWWYFEDLNKGWTGVIKVKGVSEVPERVNYTEGYFNDEALFDTAALKQRLTRPATNEEIAYYMGLHADRLYKDGCSIDRTKLQVSKGLGNVITLELGVFSFNTSTQAFKIGGVNVRDAHGKWATVVTEKPKKKMVKKSVKLQRVIDELNEQRKKNLLALHQALEENKRLKQDGKGNEIAIKALDNERKSLLEELRLLKTSDMHFLLEQKASLVEGLEIQKGIMRQSLKKLEQEVFELKRKNAEILTEKHALLTTLETIKSQTIKHLG